MFVSRCVVVMRWLKCHTHIKYIVPRICHNHNYLFPTASLCLLLFRLVECSIRASHDHDWDHVMPIFATSQSHTSFAQLYIKVMVNRGGCSRSQCRYATNNARQPASGTRSPRLKWQPVHRITSKHPCSHPANMLASPLPPLLPVPQPPPIRQGKGRRPRI